MVYFSQQPYAPKSSRETQQWGRVLDFKEDFPKEGLWWPYDGPDQFEDLVRGHLSKFVRRLGKPHVSKEEPVRETPTPLALSRAMASFLWWHWWYWMARRYIAREIGERQGEGNAFSKMSLVPEELGSRKQAIERAEAALKIYEQIEDPNAERVRRQLEQWKGQ